MRGVPSRRALLTLLAALLGPHGCGGYGAPAPSPSPVPRPNIVLVVVDTLRADHLPFMGYPRDTAPFLNSLAARGVVFERALSTSGWTVPAVGSIFTSLYPQQHGMVLGLKRIEHAKGRDQKVGSLPTAVRTLPQVLRRSGYQTLGVIDNVILSPRRGFDRGFDRFVVTRNGGAEVVGERVLAWKDKIDPARPYFLFLHYNDPHHPYLRREPWFTQFARDGKVKDMEAQQVAAYDSEVRWLDDHLRALHEKLGWDRNTVVVLTADHGEEFLDHGSDGHSSGLYGELLNVPLLVWESGGRYGPRRIPEAVSHVDILPTLRAIAGLPAEPTDMGKSLLPLLAEGRGGDPRRTLFAHIRPWGNPDINAVVEGRWKLILYPDGRRELFDVSADPRETTNLAELEKATADRLAANQRRFEEAAPRYETKEVTAPLDPEEEENLRTLGYIK
jgi:choline-sulfatase